LGRQGGNTAVMFAAACPERVTSLVVRASV
jgi:hypothetical protein